MEQPVITAGENIQYNLKMFSPGRRNFSMLYDTNYKLAYWVAYPLSSSYLGSAPRTDAWGMTRLLILFIRQTYLEDIR